MGHITIEIPDETLLALKVSQDEAGETVRMAAAFRLTEEDFRKETRLDY